MDVGIRELKAKLSHYVAKAADGTAVVITDRGKPVARLVPIDEGSNLARGLEEGWIEPARRTKLTAAKPLPGLESTQRVLDQDRG